MNQNIMRIIRKKRRPWNWSKTTKDHLEYQTCLDVHKSVTKIIHNEKKYLEKNLAKNLKNNPHKLY